VEPEYNNNYLYGIGQKNPPVVKVNRLSKIFELFKIEEECSSYPLPEQGINHGRKL